MSTDEEALLRHENIQITIEEVHYRRRGSRLQIDGGVIRVSLRNLQPMKL